MIKTYYFILLAICLCFATGSMAQKTTDNNSDVTIHVTDAVTFREDMFLWINIQRTQGHIKVTYKLLDTVDMPGFFKDTLCQALRSKFDNHTPTDTSRKGIATQFKVLLERYKTYYTDSVLLDSKHFAAYNRMLTKVAKATQKELETDKTTTVMDGDSMDCTIISEGQTKVISGNSDLSVTRPVIFRLITRTLDLARDEQHPTVLKIHQKFRF